MAFIYSERWRPPLLAKPSSNLAGRIQEKVRRLFDIQAGSAWRDVAAVLPHVRGRVLDVGCGAQPFRALIHPEVSYCAIDTDEAASHFGYRASDTIYFQGDLWPIPDASVDFILCTETIEHVLDTRLFLAEAWRCLDSHGSILITAPFAARWHFIPYDYWRFTPSCIKHLLTQAGFGRIQVYARGNAGTVACYKMMAPILSLIASQGATRLSAIVMRGLGILLLPVLVIFTLLANLTLLGRGGNDCLGYTIIADKFGASTQSSGTS